MAHLFPQIEIKNTALLLMRSNLQLTTSTVKGCVSYPGLKEYNGETFNSGFKNLPHESQNFEAVGKLSNLGLGIFNDITVPIYKGGFEITFTRNNDNNTIFRWNGLKADGTEGPTNLPAEGTVKTSTLYLRVPVIEYSIEVKTNLVNDLFKENYLLPCFKI